MNYTVWLNRPQSDLSFNVIAVGLQIVVVLHGNVALCSLKISFLVSDRAVHWRDLPLFAEPAKEGHGAPTHGPHGPRKRPSPVHLGGVHQPLQHTTDRRVLRRHRVQL